MSIKLMTVSKLIRELFKMPKSAIIVWKDHDQAPNEFNGYVDYVREAEPELEAEMERRWGKKFNVVVLGG